MKSDNHLFKVAVIRGGNISHKNSLTDGASVLLSLDKLGHKAIDVYVDKDGKWFNAGLETNPHKVFSSVDCFVDTTFSKNNDYHILAEKMGIPKMLSYQSFPINHDRENIYRLLRQDGFSVPDTVVIRSTEGGEKLILKLKEFWTTFHTPVLVRALDRYSCEPSFLVRGFKDLVKYINYFTEKKIDAHILSYKEEQTFSVAVLPNYRGERFYTPIPVKTLNNKKNLPDKDSVNQVLLNCMDSEKSKIIDTAISVCDILQPSDAVLVDLIPYKNSYMVVNVEGRPSFREDGRFMKSLGSTGCELGHYLYSRVND